ncbi:Maf family protein [Kaarinaea lacus]
MDLPYVYLASSSPRRQLLLQQLGLHFEALHPDIDETRRENESAQDYVGRLALEKARVGWQLLRSNPAAPVIGADTCIVVDNEILGKPVDKDHALQMLEKLSARWHQVFTAVAIVGRNLSRNKDNCKADSVGNAIVGDDTMREQLELSVSEVEFRAISADEREAYWQSGEPADKAGGYAIQGKGAAFVKQIRGSYSGIVGLPLCETESLLKSYGIEIFRRSAKF